MLRCSRKPEPLSFWTAYAVLKIFQVLVEYDEFGVERVECERCCRDVRQVEFKKKVGWGYDSEDLEKAIVVIREDVSKRQNGGYYGDSSYYDPDTSTEFHIGKSSADTVIRPNTKGLRRCSEEPRG